MEKTVAVASAPITFLDGTGKQVSIASNAFWFEGGELKVDAAKLPVGAPDWVVGWLQYQARTGVIVPAPPGTQPSTPAVVFQARVPGSTGNDISLDVTYASPPTSFTLKVQQKTVYEDLTLASLTEVLGTAQKAGTRPGLVRVKGAPASLHDSTQTGTIVGADETSRGTWTAKRGAVDAFTLEASEPGTNTVDVSLTQPQGQTFSLQVRWEKSLSGLTAANLATELAKFGHVLTATAPQGGFTLPRSGTFLLRGGADSTYASLVAAPKPA